jgi:aminopeptidase N
VAHLRELDDQLSRALAWASLYDATRDAELPAHVFVDAVVANAAGETDPAVIETLLAQARTAAVVWAGDSELLERLADLCRTELAVSDPGGDLQLRWARSWVSSTQDADALRALLDAGPAGLVVDAELRWHAVRRLAVLGAGTEDDVVAELARDTTSAGERHADWARAARPDAAAKESAWALATGDTSLSNHQTEALAGGFWQIEQAELCRPYVERYFAEIAAIWSERTPQVAESLGRLLYPYVVVDAAVLDRTEAFLADETLPAGLRRTVLERADDLRRAVAARARARA